MKTTLIYFLHQNIIPFPYMQVERTYIISQRNNSSYETVRVLTSKLRVGHYWQGHTLASCIINEQ